MSKHVTKTGRAGAAPAREEDDPRRAQRPREDTALVLCAGCGATLPPGEAVVVDVLAADVRCDLCWRSLLAAQAAQWRHEQTQALGPQGEERHEH